MGRPPKSQEEIDLNRNAGHRTREKLEEGIDLELSLPDPPAWLDEIALAEWKRMSTILYEQGLLTEVDVMLLAGYCMDVSNLSQCIEIIKDKGGLAVYLAGQNSQTTPEIALMRTSKQNIQSFYKAFGLLPVQGKRRKKPKEEKAKDDLLHGRG